jgi:hypothetical protein
VSQPGGFRAYLNASWATEIDVETEEEARQIVTDRLIHEEHTMTIGGLEVTVWFDDTPDFEPVQQPVQQEEENSGD